MCCVIADCPQPVFKAPKQATTPWITVRSWVVTLVQVDIEAGTHFGEAAALDKNSDQQPLLR